VRDVRCDGWIGYKTTKERRLAPSGIIATASLRAMVFMFGFQLLFCRYNHRPENLGLLFFEGSDSLCIVIAVIDDASQSLDTLKTVVGS
jgi:hypothetical protein